MKINQHGMSLVAVMIAVGIMGALALGIAQLATNMSEIKKDAYNTMDEMNLNNLVYSVLKEDKHCDISTVGPDPTTPLYSFQKTAVDEIDDPTEGQEVVLWFSDASGANYGQKRLEAGQRYGGLTIDSVKLYYPLPTSYGPDTYANLPDGQSDHFTTLVVRYKKYRGKTIVDRRLEFDLKTRLNSTSGTSELISCLGTADEEAFPTEEQCLQAMGSWDESTVPRCELRAYPKECDIRLSWHDTTDPFKHTQMPLDAAGWIRMGVSGNVNGDDDFVMDAKCDLGTTHELSQAFATCSLRLGQKDLVHSDADHRTPTRTSTKNVGYGYSTSSPLVPDGGVQGDDSFYVDWTCPGTSPEVNYLRNNCKLCIGQADVWRNMPTQIACDYMAEHRTPGRPWSRFVVDGGMGNDDSFFVGFTCHGDEMVLRDESL